MSLRVEFLSGAGVDLQDIFNRFEEYRGGFGVEFLTVVEAYLARIAVFPEIAPPYFESIRRQVMQRFPYGIFMSPSPLEFWLRRYSSYDRIRSRFCDACDTKRLPCDVANSSGSYSPEKPNQ